VLWLVVIAFVWAVGGLSLWWMFRPRRPRRDDHLEAKRERGRQIERDRLKAWERQQRDRDDKE
jgi:hypothetical protein